MRDKTTRRTFLTGVAAALAGCSVSSSDTPSSTDTATPSTDRGMNVMATDEWVESEEFAYRPETAVVYDSVPRAWVGQLPHDYREGETPDRFLPAAGWRFYAVRMAVKNVDEHGETPPYPSTRFGVYDLKAAEVWDADDSHSLRADGYDAFTGWVDTRKAAPGDVQYPLYPDVAPDPLDPGATAAGAFVALVPADTDPAAFRPTVGLSDGTDVTYTHRWENRPRVRESPTATNESNHE